MDKLLKKKCTKTSSRSRSPSYSPTPENVLSHSKSKHGLKYTTKKEAHDVYDPYVEENVLPPCPSTSECYKGPDEWQIETPTGYTKCCDALVLGSDITKVGVSQLNGSANENEVDEVDNRWKCMDSENSKTKLSDPEHNKDSTTNDSTKETPGVDIPYVNGKEDSQKSIESFIDADTCLAPKNLKVFNFLLKLKVYPFC